MNIFVCRCGSDAKFKYGSLYLCTDCYTIEIGKEFDRIHIKLYKEKCDKELGVVS